MHLHFESNVNTKCDCTILSLSWMGKVPDDIPEDEGWKLNRTNYYQEGWLATGNIRGIVGVTFTTSHCRKNMDYPLRTNYNLRGHRSDVILVKWNEPYQKLASCDSSGIIFVWIKYEGRWSIELINDRNTPVTHFSWSHDGRMALICYQDGFVLVGSVAGQRYWSSMLNLESTITCGIWTPDDQQVYFGTTQGQVIVMDVHGAMVSQVQLCNDVGITAMAWSCEKFKMEEGEESEPGVTNAAKRSFVLAVSFQNGFIYLLKSFDDVSPAHINTGLNGTLGFVMEWSNSRELLAVAGTVQNTAADSQASQTCENVLKFYTECGTLLFQTRIPNSTFPVSALTWGHNDKRLFIATGTQVHIAWVSRRVATLQLLCRLRIQSSVGSESRLHYLPLPSRIKSLIGYLFAQTIRCCVPDAKSLREFVSRPPMCSTRLHCTMIRHDDDSNLSSGTCYTLYLEYLGGLVPLLKGKRTSKIRPEFVIFDPQMNDSYSLFLSSTVESKSLSASSHSTTTRTDSSDSEFEDHIRGSPRTLRKRKIRQKRISHLNTDRSSANGTNSTDPEALDELAYVDTLPEEVKLVEVTSNIWGTKFKIHGLAKTVPANLGQVTYKTSLLHLQPRQMTLVITELRDDFPPGPDPTFNPNLFSEDEEDPASITNAAHHIQFATPNTSTVVENSSTKQHNQCQWRLNENVLPIAPMSPFLNRLTTANQRQRNATNFITPLAKAESYDDDSSNESMDKLMMDATSNASCSMSNSNNNINKVNRPKTITTCTPGFRNNYGSRSSSNSSCQSRHAISPLYCDGSVPTLQSPKSAVAPADIIFERPAVPVTGQTTLMSYSSNSDYTSNVVQVKNALMSDSIRAPNSHVNPVPLNLSLNLERMDTKIKTPLCSLPRRNDIRFIDEESQSPTQNQHNTTVTVSAEVCMQRTPTCVSIAPALPRDMPRSCSVGYLDAGAVTPSDEALSALRRDAPNKRLILVNNRKQRKKRQNDELATKPRLQQTGKSKSFDSCMLLPTRKYSTTQAKQLDEKTVQKLNEISEISTTEEYANCFKCRNNINLKDDVCKRCKNSTKPSIVESLKKEQHKLNKIRLLCNLSKDQTGSPISKKIEEMPSSPLKKRFDVITSFTDSPLFTRKHRFGLGKNKQSAQNSGTNTENSTPIMARKNEYGFSFVKQLAEARWRRKEAAADLQTSGNVLTEQTKKNTQFPSALSNNTVEATPVEAKTSVSLHTQALTTLENIISRLRDLDEGKCTPPSTPQRLPRSSPASPAVSKKNKRQQSNSPIRHILNSPLLNRRQRKKPQNLLESSDDEGNHTNSGSGGEERESFNDNLHNKQYRDLETFQKAQLRQKLKRGKIEPNGTASNAVSAPVRREFVMHNKAPMWNEMSQVYQLDFGGRVTQESAKNFQIEFRGKQVMQFGRIDGNAYTLDFQYPFSALQAFAVALANVTQRLK